jgi:hypothetical protein
MNDSLLTFDELCQFYARVESAVAGRPDGASYLGQGVSSLWRPVSRNRWPAWLNPGEVVGLMETQEVALDLERLRAHLGHALEGRPAIETLYGNRVESAERTTSGFRVCGTAKDSEIWQAEADILVNCLWADRLQLDETLGLRPNRSWVHRLKYRLLGELPGQLAHLPSLTFVLGPYGDIATYPNARTYFSWYPACLQGWSDELMPPAAWDDVRAGNMPTEAAAGVIRDSLEALDRIVPGVGRSNIQHVDGGVIFSWGQVRVDVDDPASELHQRHAIGVHAHDGYFSIDTGKFTCAPLFANQLLAALDP